MPRTLEEIFRDTQGQDVRVSTSPARNIQSTQPSLDREPSFSELPGNIIPSAKRFGEDVFSIFRDPVGTVKGLARTAAGAAEKIIPGEKNQFQEESEAQFDAVVDFFRQRYGTPENTRRTLIEDPVGAAGDIAAVLSGGGGVVRAGAAGVTKASSVTRAGTVSRAAQRAGRVGQTAQNVAATIDPVVGTTRLVTRAAKRLPLTKVSERLVASSLKLTPSATQKIKRPNIAGESPERWLLKRGISGSADDIATQLDDLADFSKTSLDDGLLDISNIYSKVEVPRVNQALTLLEETFTNTAGNEDIIGRIKQLKNQRQYTLSDINEIKRVIDDELDIFAKSGEVKSGVTARGLRNIRGDIQHFIENEAAKAGFPEVAELNKQTQVSKEISNAIKAAESRRSSNRVLTLTDLMVGTGGFVGGFDVIQITGLVIGKKILESPRFKTALAKNLNRLNAEDYYVVQNAFEEGKATERAKTVMKRVLEEAKREAVLGVESVRLQSETQPKRSLEEIFFGQSFE